MPDHVGQTLLKNSESRGGSISIQVQIDRWNRDLATNIIAGSKLGGLPFDGCCKPQVVQYSRTQPTAYPSHRFNAIIDQLNRLCQTSEYRDFRLWEMTRHPCQIHFDCSQNLPDLIVQVTGDSLAVLFADLLKSFSQGPQLFFLHDDALVLAKSLAKLLLLRLDLLARGVVGADQQISYDGVLRVA